MSTRVVHAGPLAIGILGAVALLLLFMGMAAAPVSANAKEKVTICHATSAENNPYVAIKVAANSGYAPHLSDNEGNSALAGHEQDFLLENTDRETCDDVDDPVTPLAPSVSAATCDAPGALTLTAVNGVSYTIEPEYEPGDTGAFTVTATADDGYVLEEGAEDEFEVTIPARLDCPDQAAAAAPGATGATCDAPGALTLNPVTGVVYAVVPAYTAGASGSFTVNATPAAGYELTGQTTFVVNVPAKLVCNQGTLAGNPPTAGGTQAGLPNTAMDPMSGVGGVLALVALVGVWHLARRNVASARQRD